MAPPCFDIAHIDELLCRECHQEEVDALTAQLAAVEAERDRFSEALSKIATTSPYEPGAPWNTVRRIKSYAFAALKKPSEAARGDGC